MKFDLKICAIIVLLIFSGESFSQNYKFPELKGAYLGQKPPGKVPELFAPGIICTGMTERDLAISNDGKEIFYSYTNGRTNTIMYTRLLNGYWTEPEIAPFALDESFYHYEPCLSKDGKKIFFLTTRPPKGKEKKPRWTYENIWAADKNEDGTWGQPYNPDTTAINITGQLQYYPSLTGNGKMYFSRVDNNTKKPSLYRSDFSSGKFSTAEKLPEIINQPGTSVYNAFISKDESFLIACIEGRKSDINPGFANYYIFFRNDDDKWSEGIILGPEINIKGSSAQSASVSPDGKYLFFAAQKLNEKFYDISSRKSISQINNFLGSPQNGSFDIYWVDAGVIYDLKSKVVFK